MYQLAKKTAVILDTLYPNNDTQSAVEQWAQDQMNKTYSEEVMALTSIENGLHYSVSNLTEDKLRSFEIGELSSNMADLAPNVWTMLDSLFRADPRLEYKRNWACQKARAAGTARRPDPGTERTADADIGMEDVSIYPIPEDKSTEELQEYLDSIWNSDDPYMAEEVQDEPEDAVRHAEERYDKQITIVSDILYGLPQEMILTIVHHLQRKVVALSIMMQSTNQKCNALQCIVGIFLQSCNCPETLCDLLTRIGLSISATAINGAVSNLSSEAGKAMTALAQTLLILLAWDNVDFNLKHSVPTVEAGLGSDTLVHLTSGTLIPLSHGVTLADLDCSEMLWKKSPYNPEIGISLPKIPDIDVQKLFTLFPETRNANSLFRRERYNAWKFLYDLAHHGPEYFRRFKPQLGDAEEIDCIPISKTEQVPCRTLNIHPNTNAANREAILGFLSQCKVGDPTESPGSEVKSPGNHVILASGDVLTGDRVRGLMESRGEEATPWLRFQYIIFVMGLFHLKMAAADAIWRIFIHPNKALRTTMGDNGLLDLVGQIRPRATGKIESKPGFRRMHEVIQHIGIVSRLDCWRLAATKKNPEHKALVDFSSSKPTWEALQKMAISISRQCGSVASVAAQKQMTNQGARDTDYENSLVRHQYFLLYKELSYGINYGDIGRVEQCFLPWIFIFQGCGKHKYATELRRYLHNVYFVYPAGLK